jgi:DNA uptake protein ComE-like DNA-binding protein
VLILISYLCDVRRHFKSFIVENLFFCKKYKVSGKFSIMNSGDKLHINVCTFDDLLGLPSVGKATAYKIWEQGPGGGV